MDFSKNTIKPTGLSKLQKTNWSKPTGLQTNIRKDYEILLEELEDLLNPQYQQWYRGVFFKVGKDTVLRLASTSRSDGSTKLIKAKLFSKLLKAELSKQNA
jgi:hypothetical protein